MATPLASSSRCISLSSDSYEYRPITAAIDFGTSSSGYAFAFKENGTDKFKVPFLNKWQMGSAYSSTDKAPTCLLLKPDKTFDSFGYTAEDKYARLCDTNRQKGWWYFEKFKMLLYQTKNLSRSTSIDDSEGKAMRAIDVFINVIAHLKECILQQLRVQNYGIRDDDIQYVMTVPAIWSDAAKQFMREAATDPKVGIKDDQLHLVLEPEAASVYCRQAPSDMARQMGCVESVSLPVGHKYIIADLGGGTVDIATHEVIENDKLHEIHVARGDDIGGQTFDTQFLEFLESLFGHELFRKWKISECGDYIMLIRTIEGIKWDITKSEEDVLFRIEIFLMDIVRDDTDEGLDKLVSKSAFKRSVDVAGKAKLSLKNGFIRSFFGKTLMAKLSLKNGFIRSFFGKRVLPKKLRINPFLSDNFAFPAIKGVEEHIRAITNVHGDIETIFLVGGLAKAPYIQESIRSKFPGYRLIAPEDPGLAVLRGAILLGNTPQTIAGRIARCTYGIGVCRPFIEGIHMECHRITIDGEDLCNNRIRKLIEKNQVLKYGQIFETTTEINAKQPETKDITFTTYLYQSTYASPNDLYLTDEGYTKIGGFGKVPPEGGWPDYCVTTVQLVVGEAEFKLHVKTLDRTYEQKIDFLLL